MIYVVIFETMILIEVILFVYFFFKFQKVSDIRDMVADPERNKQYQKQQWEILRWWIINAFIVFLLSLYIALNIREL